MEIKDTVLGILTDVIIFERTLKGVMEILTAHGPNDCGWEASQQYNGFANAYGLLVMDMELKDDLIDRLYNVFFDNFNIDYCQSPLKRSRASALAQLILSKWEKELERYRYQS